MKKISSMFSPRGTSKSNLATGSPTPALPAASSPVPPPPASAPVPVVADAEKQQTDLSETSLSAEGRLYNMEKRGLNSYRESVKNGRLRQGSLLRYTRDPSVVSKKRIDSIVDRLEDELAAAAVVDDDEFLLAPKVTLHRCTAAPFHRPTVPPSQRPTVPPSHRPTIAPPQRPTVPRHTDEIRRRAPKVTASLKMVTVESSVELNLEAAVQDDAASADAMAAAGGSDGAPASAAPTPDAPTRDLQSEEAEAARRSAWSFADPDGFADLEDEADAGTAATQQPRASGERPVGELNTSLMSELAEANLYDDDEDDDDDDGEAGGEDGTGGYPSAADASSAEVVEAVARVGFLTKK